MQNIQVKKQIKKYTQIQYSLEWNVKLLEEIKDDDNLKKIQNIRELYKSKAFDLMRENNINKISIDVTKSTKITLSIDENLNKS